MKEKQYWLISLVLIALWLLASINAVKGIESGLAILILVGVFFVGIVIKNQISYRYGIPFFAFYAIYYFLMLFYSFSNNAENSETPILFVKFLALVAITFCLFKSKKLSIPKESISIEEASEISRNLSGQDDFGSEEPVSEDEIAEGVPLQKSRKRRRGRLSGKSAEEMQKEKEELVEKSEDEIEGEQMGENAEESAEENVEEETVDENEKENYSGKTDESIGEENLEEENPSVSHHCPKCGHHIDPIDKFCSNCGKRIG